MFCYRTRTSESKHKRYHRSTGPVSPSLEDPFYVNKSVVCFRHFLSFVLFCFSGFRDGSPQNETTIFVDSVLPLAVLFPYLWRYLWVSFLQSWLKRPSPPSSPFRRTSFSVDGTPWTIEIPFSNLSLDGNLESRRWIIEHRNQSNTLKRFEVNRVDITLRIVIRTPTKLLYIIRTSSHGSGIN